MMQPATKRLLSSTLILMMFAAFIGSCQYEFIEIDQPDPNVTVKFSEKILPIFSDKNCTACHRTGNTSPDLTDLNAYNGIVPALVNLTNPAQSKIYTVPAPASSHGARYSAAQAALVLTWIQQGALNN